MKFRTCLLAIGLAGAAVPAQAQGFTDSAAIEREVAAFLGVSAADAGSAFVPVDRRLRLAACNRPLALGWQGARRDAVLVQCPDPGSWKLYVRVVGQAAGVVAPPAVRRGDAVTVTVRGSGFSISQPAQALEDGAPGDWVRIRVGKDTELQAQVLRPGAVAMNLQ